ncbi:MAG: hypothetical protein SFT93_03295 [Rickettsiaceae bacterium]|nr:hypothetical protein [Rickettsiaceae bacterium]
MFDEKNGNLEEEIPSLSNLQTVSESKSPDTIDEMYSIDVSQMIPELSNEYAKYYHAIDTKTGENFYAIIFERTFAPDLVLIKTLMNQGSQKINKPLALSVVNLSITRTKHLAVLVEAYDIYDTLISKFPKVKSGNSEFIRSKLLPFLCGLLEFCDEYGLNLGNINTSNIIIRDDQLILREPFIHYPHATQEIAYLAMELLDAEIPGRKTKTYYADLYAAGVTILHTYFAGPLTKSSPETLKQERRNIGSFFAILGKRRITDDLKLKVKSCLHDNPQERFKLKNLQDWISGKLQLAQQTIQKEQTDSEFAPVSFAGVNYLNNWDLASALHKKWDLGLHFLGEERVQKWIQRSSGKNKMIDELEELTSRDFSKGFSSMPLDKEERLVRAISILDPFGPIRLQNFSSHISSFGNMYFMAYIQNKRSIQDSIVKIALKKVWEDNMSKYGEHEQDHVMIERLNSLAGFYSGHSHACGLERVLYHLNPDLPCLSPLVFNEYVTNSKSLLLELEKIAEKKPENFAFDRHIVSFMAAKLNLKREVYANITKDIPSEYPDLLLHGLALMILTLKRESDMNLPYIASFIGTRVSNFVRSRIRNVQKRTQMVEQINVASVEKNWATIYNIATNAQMYDKDKVGYYKATRELSILTKKIEALANINDIREYGIVFGQRITVLTSYVLFMLVTFILMF